MLALVSAGEFLGLTLWFSATAATGAISHELRLSPSATAWLTMAVQGGFVCGTFASALLNLPDVMNARRLFAVGAALGAAANYGVTFAGSAASAILFRFATGFALAGVYPPGMKIAAGWFDRRRGTALGVLVGALTLGSAVPHLLAARGMETDWRALVRTSSWLAVGGGAIVLLLVRDGPYVAATARFDPRAVRRVFSRRGTRLATLGYLGHMWELYAMWTWIAAFAAASITSSGAGGSVRGGSLVAFVALAAGAAGCVAAGVVADRVGRAKVAGISMIASAGCCVLAGTAFGGASVWLFVLAMVWGAAIVSDSAQFSALVSEHSEPGHVGTALTVQTCAGFLLTMVSIRLIGWASATIGWQWTFALLAPGPLLGALAMKSLANRGA
jgi:MFS family permease